MRWLHQGCHTKNPNLSLFWRALKYKMLLYFMAVWISIRLFGIFNGLLVNFDVIWYVFPVLVCCATKNLATLGATTMHVD
jgi:hypothetical protein